MTASKSTVDEIVDTIHEWCADRGIKTSDVRMLLRWLTDITNDESFQDTVKLVHGEFISKFLSSTVSKAAMCTCCWGIGTIVRAGGAKDWCSQCNGTGAVKK